MRYLLSTEKCNEYFKNHVIISHQKIITPTENKMALSCSENVLFYIIVQSEKLM